MRQKISKLESKDRAEMLHLAQMHAEVAAKDRPPQEARDWFDAELADKPDLWRVHGDLMAEATDGALAGQGYAFKASVVHGAKLLKAEFGYDESSPVIKLLIEQAVLCYVRLGIVEDRYSRALTGSYALAVGAHWEMRLTLCQGRYMKALATLAKVRGLLARAELAEAHAAIRKPRMLKALQTATG